MLKAPRGAVDLNAVLARERGDAAEPDGLARIVGVGHHQGHFDPALEQHREAAASDVVVGEDDGSGHSFFSSTAWTT
jgi:hypothetical protein